MILKFKFFFLNLIFLSFDFELRSFKMIFSRIDFEFNDFVFILIAKSLIASLKSIIYNEIIIISKTLFILNLIFYFFSFSSTRFRYNLFSNLINSFFFFSKLLFLLLFFVIFNKKIVFDFDLNLLIFEIESKTSTFFLFFKDLITIFENILYNIFKFFVK